MFLFLNKDFCGDLFPRWWSGILLGNSRTENTQAHGSLHVCSKKLRERKKGKHGPERVRPWYTSHSPLKITFQPVEMSSYFEYSLHQGIIFQAMYLPSSMSSQERPQQCWDDSVSIASKLTPSNFHLSVWDKPVNFPGHTGSSPIPSSSQGTLPLSLLSPAPSVAHICSSLPTQRTTCGTTLCIRERIYEDVETPLPFCSSRVFTATSLSSQRFTEEGVANRVRQNGTLWM